MLGGKYESFVSDEGEAWGRFLPEPRRKSWVQAATLN